MHTRTQTAPHTKNRATGYTDADWGQLEKRLSDTRDLLRDILSHLRRVLDNLKTVGARYEGAGRASRQNSAYQPGDARRQHGYRPQGPSAGARKSYGTAAGPSSTAGTRYTAGAAPGAATGAGHSTRANTTSANASSHTTTAGQPRTGDSFREKASERKPEGGFSWSARGTGQTGASSQSGNARQTGQAGSAAGAASAGERKTTFGDWRTGQNSRTYTGSAGAHSSTAGGAGSSAGERKSTFGDWRTNQNSRTNAGSAGAGSGQHRQSAGSGQRAGASGQSAGDSYRQQARKPAPRTGMMTLTNACALLCVSYPCTPDEIKAAYRKQARRHHPDLGGDEEMMKSINQAYETALSWCSPMRGKSGVWAA